MSRQYDEKDIFQAIEEIKEDIRSSVKKTLKDFEEARARGNEVTSVICSPGVKIGDIIDVKKITPEDLERLENDETYSIQEDSEAPVIKARVLDIHPFVYMDTETEELIDVVEALVECLQDGQLMDVETFHELYGDKDSSTEVKEEKQLEVNLEEQDSSTCECGADKTDCERSQSVFGVHVND